MDYECTECGYTETRSLMITRTTPDANALCPDCERTRLIPQKIAAKAERTRTNNFKRYFSRKRKTNV
jgi:hypothetical protein